MITNLRRRLIDARDWVRAVRHHRSNDHSRFLEAVDALARRKPLSRYQLVIKASALLLSGRHNEATALYSTLSGEEGEGANAAYISLYARAMIADLSGDRAEYDRNAKAALDLRLPLISRLLFRQNLPL
jgi:hypothetical protein